ncbi:ArsR/SmtB family transcription factor [Salibacterium sp. K-3]
MIKTFKTLAEPKRLHIVELLREGPLTVGEVSDRLGLNQPQTSKHLRVLTEAELVQVDPVANRRIYQLQPQRFKELDEWLNSFRSLWEERFDNLDDYLYKLQNKEENDDKL